MANTPSTPAIEEERAFEANETALLKQSVKLLQAALQQLAGHENEVKEEKNTPFINFQILAGRFTQASIEISSAATQLRNSVADKEKIKETAESIANMARTEGNVTLFSIEEKTISLAKNHKNTIENIIRQLEGINSILDKVTILSEGDLNENYPKLNNLRRVAISEIGNVIAKIDNYAKGLDSIFKLFDAAEGKKPSWKFW